MFKYTSAIFACVGLIITSSLFAQKKIPAKENPSNCEYVRHALSESLIKNEKIESSNVIFIFRLGREESSKKVIAKRIKTVKNFIKFRIPNFDRFIVAEGEKNNGLGKVEIYIGEKLEWELYTKRNADLGYDCLEEPY